MSNKEYCFLENSNSSTSSDMPQDQLNKNNLNASSTISNYLKLLSENSKNNTFLKNHLNSSTIREKIIGVQTASTNDNESNSMNPKYCPICDDNSDDESTEKSSFK